MTARSVDQDGNPIQWNEEMGYWQYADGRIYQQASPLESLDIEYCLLPIHYASVEKLVEEAADIMAKHAYEALRSGKKAVLYFNVTIVER